MNLRSFIEKLLKFSKTVIPKLQPDQEEKQTQAEELNGDAVAFSDLNFCWGGFKPGAAAEIKATIGDLKVASNKMSYTWQDGGCEQLGAADKADHTKTLACLFCLIAGMWRGGKFDWISTSRTSRDFANIQSGYNGWDKDAIEKADAYAFVIMASNGKARTNVIRSVK